MAVQEPALDLGFMNWPQETQPGELLKVQYRQSMILRNIPYTVWEQRVRRYPCASIASKCDDPVEHLHQEWEFLQNAAVEIICETGCIWCPEDKSAAASLLRRVFHCGYGIEAPIVGCYHTVPREQIVRRTCRVRVEFVAKYPVVLLSVKYSKILPASKEHGCYEDRCY